MKKAITYFGIILLVAFALLFILLLAFSAILSVFNDGKVSKDDIISLVMENKETLLNDISNEDFTNCKKIHGIKEVYVEDSYIEFYCGGSGMGGQSTYCGFRYYYDHNNLPDKLYNGGYVREGNGYIYRQPDGDNEFYFEQITENFYYFHEKY